MPVIVGIVILVALLVLAAYLAASETSLMRSSRIRVRYLVEKKVRKAQILENLIQKPEHFLPSLLLMVLIVQLTSASIATWLVTRISGNAGVGVAVGTALITVMMFIFGELIPKSLASHDSEKIALKVVKPVVFIERVLRPISFVLEGLARVIMRVFLRKELTVDAIVHDEGEIKAMVSAAEENNVIEEEEKDLIHSVFEFGDMIVREVMVPRPDMVTLPIDATVRDALVLVIENGFSRIPVYEGNLDSISGILYAKDLLLNLKEGKLDQEIRGLIREAYFIPETKRLGDLLRELQKRKVHMAIVVDEYGTVTGLVTIEDLLEEIVGEIFDEYDREVKLIEEIYPGKYTLDARLSIDDLNELMNTDIPSEDFDTVGGLVLKILGEVPKPGASFVLNGLVFTVEKVRNNRISKVTVEVLGDSSVVDFPDSQ